MCRETLCLGAVRIPSKGSQLTLDRLNYNIKNEQSSWATAAAGGAELSVAALLAINMFHVIVTTAAEILYCNQGSP